MESDNLSCLDVFHNWSNKDRYNKMQFSTAIQQASKVKVKRTTKCIPRGITQHSQIVFFINCMIIYTYPLI